MWKLLSAIVLNIILMIILPYLLAYMGYMNEIKDKAWLILIITCLVISIKTVMGDIASGKFEYHKHGYDFCITSLGASMTALCLQLTSTSNLFPELNQFGLFQSLSNLAKDPITATTLCLVVILVFSSFFMILTARISKAITQDSTRYPDLLSLTSFALGAGILGLYTLILITRA